jgi:hypothetical protein
MKTYWFMLVFSCIVMWIGIDNASFFDDWVKMIAKFGSLIIAFYLVRKARSSPRSGVEKNE